MGKFFKASSSSSLGGKGRERKSYLAVKGSTGKTDEDADVTDRYRRLIGSTVRANIVACMHAEGKGLAISNSPPPLPNL